MTTESERQTLLAYLEELLNAYWKQVGDEAFEAYLHKELLKARLAKYKRDKAARVRHSQVRA